MEKTIITAHEATLTKLMFYNLLNQASASNTAVNFDSVYHAEQSCPMLKKIVDKLSPREFSFLLDRIEAVR